ncbi:hypothetical protein [Sporolactobacillus terrae]|uniref:Uncharacterized protein n=1 Tax=Sporolactobacillus terrae TaxID=269673 RepID=A0A5K7WU59_9BACL|nr:hypothetical protein [Sporolactobacillus terrae]BBN97867.1 hypothetical protein St703_05720 [Sporolactobacillus terrae]
MDLAIILFISLAFLLSFYNAFGYPFNLNKAVHRIFDDHITYYDETSDTLTIKAENVGWDGTEWSKKHAKKDGVQQIKKLDAAVHHYAPSIKQINVTITYLGKVEIKRTLFSNRSDL